MRAGHNWNLARAEDLQEARALRRARDRAADAARERMERLLAPGRPYESAAGVEIALRPELRAAREAFRERHRLAGEAAQEVGEIEEALACA